MSEMAIVACIDVGVAEAQQSALSSNELRLIQHFRQMTDREKHQVLRLIEVLTPRPEVTPG